MPVSKWLQFTDGYCYTNTIRKGCLVLQRDRCTIVWQDNHTVSVTVLITCAGVLHQSKGCEWDGHPKGSMHTATTEPILSSISQMGLETLLSPCLNFISATAESVFDWQTSLVSKEWGYRILNAPGRSQQFRLTNHKVFKNWLVTLYERFCIHDQTCKLWTKIWPAEQLRPTNNAPDRQFLTYSRTRRSPFLQASFSKTVHTSRLLASVKLKQPTMSIKMAPSDPALSIQYIGN